MFSICFEHTIGNEGGYYNNPKDTGGPTKYGIAYNYNKERLLTVGVSDSSQMASLTLEQARAFYYSGYWLPAKCQLLGEHTELLKTYFDMVIHAGVRGAGRCLQRALNHFNILNGVIVDGRVGNNTITLYNSTIDNHYEPDVDTNDFNLHVVFNAERAIYYCDMFADSNNTSWFGNKRFLNSGLRRLT